MKHSTFALVERVKEVQEQIERGESVHFLLKRRKR